MIGYIDTIRYDKAIVDFIESFKTRLNSFLKKLRDEFETVYREKKYLGDEFESMEDDNYREASSDTQAINNITNKVVSSLVVQGSDMRVIELCAKNCKVSTNVLRSYISTMVVNDQRDEIENIVESLIYLYLKSEGSEGHSITGIGSNDFLIHCLKVYKKSNTVDDNVIKIKAILDKWLKDLHVADHASSGTTMNNFRRAFYMFFVFSIIKLN